MPFCYGFHVFLSYVLCMSHVLFPTLLADSLSPSVSSHPATGTAQFCIEQVYICFSSSAYLFCIWTVRANMAMPPCFCVVSCTFLTNGYDLKRIPPCFYVLLLRVTMFVRDLLRLIFGFILHLHLKFFVSCSPVSPITNVLPLSMVLFVSLVKEAWEDWVSTISSLRV